MTTVLNTLTHASGELPTEGIQDLINAFFAAGTGVTLTYDDALGTFTVAAPLAYDPLTTMVLIDHFMSGTNGTGEIGSLGWNFGGGTVVISTATVPAVAGKPGIVRRTTSAVSGTTARTVPRTGDTTGSTILPAELFDISYRFRLNTNDANTNVQMGLSDDWSSAVSPANGIYIQKKDADTSWFGSCRASNVETRTAALAAVDTNWHTVRMRRTNGTTIAFSIDGGTELTVATTVPTAAVQPGWSITNSAAADKTIDMDLFYMKVTGLS